MKKLILAVCLAPALALGEPEVAPALVADEAPAADAAAAPAPATPAPTPAAAPEPVQTSPAAVEVVSQTSEEEQEEKSGFRIGVSLDHSMGQGTLVAPEYSSYVAGALVIAPSYGFNVRDFKLSASARASVGWEYTLPDSATGRRITYSDIRLGLAAPALYKESFTGISVSPSIGLSVPISLESLHASTITVVSANVGLSRAFGNLSLKYRLGASRGIHGSGQRLESRSNARDPFGNLIFLCRTDEEFCGTTGNNTAWSLSNSLGADYQVTEKLSVSASLGVSNSWKYAVVDEADEFTPKALDSNGNPVAHAGMGRGDRLSGSLGVSYAITDRYSVSAGMGTEGPPKTKDNKNFRFPFFDFVSGPDNLTSYSVTFSANF